MEPEVEQDSSSEASVLLLSPDEGNGASDDEFGDNVDFVDEQYEASISSCKSRDSNILKQRQEKINSSHLFGIRIWKPAIYRKLRSVQQTAEGEIHSTPSKSPKPSYSAINLLWTLAFGWWMALIFIVVSICFLPFQIFSSGSQYIHLLTSLANYIFFPFGKFVELCQDSGYASEDLGRGHTIRYYSNQEGRSISKIWDDLNHIESISLLHGENSSQKNKYRFFGRGPWNLERFIFYSLFYIIIYPMLSIVSICCWFGVFTVPMAKSCMLLTRFIQNHPLQLHFHYNISASESFNQDRTVLLCTLNAASFKYYKYTFRGTNIIIVNLLGVCILTLLYHYVFLQCFPSKELFTPSTLFISGLLSVIPLAYFIGQSVASISAQSSMGTSAALNAFFGTLVEMFLYCVALKQHKSKLVEGSVVGSILAGILLIPGMSMCAGGMVKKVLRFNYQSAVVTSTLLLFASLGFLAPTLYYQINGPYSYRCSTFDLNDFEFSDCHFNQTLQVHDPSYKYAQIFSYYSAFFLLLTYAIGLWFTLRTHSAQIWDTQDHKLSFRSSNRELSQANEQSSRRLNSINITKIQEIATEAALKAIASKQKLRSASQPQKWDKKQSNSISKPAYSCEASSFAVLKNMNSTERMPPSEGENGECNGHEVPNWSRKASFIILFAVTISYAMIAEILINQTDEILKNYGSIKEKFLGFTLFALVPNTPEFLNAVLFALNKNVALSMEIGSAYALQVCLLQVPCLVAFSFWLNRKRNDDLTTMFTLIFPRWDIFCIIFCVILFSYVYRDGKSDYFKGSILIIMYIVTLVGFYLEP